MWDIAISQLHSSLSAVRKLCRGFRRILSPEKQSWGIIDGFHLASTNYVEGGFHRSSAHLMTIVLRRGIRRLAPKLRRRQRLSARSFDRGPRVAVALGSRSPFLLEALPART